MTSLRSLTCCLAMATPLLMAGCSYDLHSIPSVEDCIEAGVGNCGGSGGSGGTGGNGGSGGNGGTGGGNGGCTLLQFECGDGDCIPNGQTCDGAGDCADGSDEDPTLCGATCGPLQFTCNNSTCILNARVCDGTDQCGDGSDEDPTLCGVVVCTGNQFTCGNGSCIDETWVCDLDNDCGDGSDEDPSICDGNVCGPCPIPSGGVVSFESCCVNSAVCGGQIAGSAECLDVYDPGVSSLECPGESLGPLPFVDGCCRTDGRCGISGAALGVGCVAREDVPMDLGGPFGPLNCEPVKTPCSSNGRCPSGEVCGDLNYETGESYCRPITPGGLPVGAACTAPGSPYECESSLCFPNSLECTAVCSSANDCPSFGSPPHCISYSSTSGSPFNICATSCKGIRDCRDDQECGVAVDTNGEIVGSCNSTSIGLRPVGALCDLSEECTSGLCVFGGIQGAVCSPVCDTPIDCPAELPVCASIQNLDPSLFSDIFVCQG